jgi:hypothetical protein
MGSTAGAGRYTRIALFVASVVTLGLAAAVFVSSSAEAQVSIPHPASSPCDPYTTHCTPIVKPSVLVNDPERVQDRELVTPPPSIPPPTSPPPRCPNCLPFTGADLTLFAATGFAAIGTGTVLVRATRRRGKADS